MATNDNKQTVWKANYSPFGKATLETNNITLNLRFPGQYHDDETGTHYNYLRDYDPETGRYITSDPIGLKGGVNTYAYVVANPLRYYDSLGLATFYDRFNEKFLQDFARDHPLEHALFKEYATAISTDLWPVDHLIHYEYAYKGFDAYARENALKYINTGIMAIQDSIYGVESWTSKILGPLKNIYGQCASIIIGTDSDFGTIDSTTKFIDLLPELNTLISELEGGGPQVINQKNWEIDFEGKPRLTAAEFEKSISKLPAFERVAIVKNKAKEVAQKNGWIKDNKLSKRNNRLIFKDKQGNYFSVDTQHGRFEKLNKKGKHQGEYNIDLELIPDSKDISGGHDIKV